MSYRSPGLQFVEFPDERTARWMTVQIHFTAQASELTINLLGLHNWKVIDSCILMWVVILEVELE